MPSVLVKHIPGDFLNKVISCQFCTSPVALEHLVCHSETLLLWKGKGNEPWSCLTCIFNHYISSSLNQSLHSFSDTFFFFFFNENFLFTLLSAWKACETWCWAQLISMTRLAKQFSRKAAWLWEMQRLTGKIRREGSHGSFLSLPKLKFGIAFLLQA